MDASQFQSRIKVSLLVAVCVLGLYFGAQLRADFNAITPELPTVSDNADDFGNG
ncbi:MAG: hypothetical protein AAF702_51065 [Chloroflexota bacterium]